MGREGEEEEEEEDEEEGQIKEMRKRRFLKKRFWERTGKTTSESAGKMAFLGS